MKTDYRIKYIFFDLKGKKYLISFRDTFFKGVHAVSVSTGTDGKGYGRENAIIEECYPGFIERLLIARRKHYDVSIHDIKR